MAMRLHEIHPSLVHFPIALLPTSVLSDVLGTLTGSRPLLDLGRRTMPLAAAGAAAAAVAGLIAQEEVVAEGEAHAILTTHRNLNAGVLASTVWMAWQRSRGDRPTWRYLALGLASVGTLAYSAYLGGHMVYEHGVGVGPAGGIEEAEAPDFGAGKAGEAAKLAAEQVAHGARHAASHIAEGEVLPELEGGGER